MIEILEGLPDNVVGLVVKGRVTQRDCAETLLPAIEKARDWHHRLRLYYEIRSRYPGAAWDEISFGSADAPAWERVAVVSDVAWIRHTVQAVRLLIPSEIRVFSTTQIPEGLAWIGEPARRPKAAPAPAAASLRHGAGRVFQPAVQYLHHAV
jgi:hypothetical protein